MRIRQEHIILLFILVLGTLLRVWRIAEIPFMHDELSVIYRTGYDSFRELIRDGVVPDVHPAGVQVFVNYWVALFGGSEPAVKLPFILAGILSIFLVYKLGKEWFGTDTALVSAAFAATLEYFVMHSQTARPYASGLFLGLLMVYAWQRYLFRPGKRQYLWLATYVIASAACAYNHYFSLMLAGIVGVSGLFFLKRRQIIPYLAACAGILLLYIPHISIFFSQLEQKGVGGWLGKPGNDFLLKYISYAFHYSPYLLSMVVAIVLAGIFLGRSRILLRNRFFYLSLAWFFVPFLIAFFYSIRVDAVLQLRVMIFFFPFLLFGLVANIPTLSRFLRMMVPLAICTAVTLSLVLERRYYELFYESVYPGVIMESEKSLSATGPDDTFVIMDSHRRISEFYFDRLGIRYEHTRIDDLDGMPGLEQMLEASDAPFLSFGADDKSDIVLQGMMLRYFPSIIREKHYYAGSYYLMARAGSENPYYFSSENDFEGSVENWSPATDSLLVTDHFPGTSCRVHSSLEFSPTFSIPFNNILRDKRDVIDVAVSVKNLDSLNNSLLVLSVGNAKGVVDWSAANFSDYDPGTGEEYTVYHSFRPGRMMRRKDLAVKIYVWNLERQDFLVDDFRIGSRPGNPVLWGLTEPL